MPKGTVLIVGTIFVAGIGAGYLMGDEHVTTVTEVVPSDEPPTFVIHDVPVPDDQAATVAEVVPQDCAQAFGEVFPAVIQAAYDLSRSEGQVGFIISDLRIAQVDGDPVALSGISDRWNKFSDINTQAYKIIGTDTHDLVVSKPGGGGMQIDPEFNQRCIVPMQDAANNSDTG